jgi:hypothetical protein
MPGLLHNKRIFIIAVLCGAIISASYYVIPPLDRPGTAESVHPLLWPILLLSFLNVVPRVFVARIIWEGLRLPDWLREWLGALYWPFLGAIVGICKRWVLWGVVVLTINIGLLALFLYALSQMKLTF